MDTRSNPNLFVLNIEPEEEDLEEESLVLLSFSNSAGLENFNLVESCSSGITLLLHDTLKD